MQTPVLTTQRLVLRPFCAADAQEVFTVWESDPEVAKYMFWHSHSDIEKTRRWVTDECKKIPSDLWYRWAISDKETGRLLGTGLLYFEEEYGNFEIAYNFGRSYWGRGYATEAMRAVLLYAKDTLQIKEVIGRYAQENGSSGRVLEKLGFHAVGEIPFEAGDGGLLYNGVLCRLVLH